MRGVGGVLTIAKQAVSVFPHPLLNRGICIMFIHLYGFWDWRFKPAVLWDANWSRCIGTRSFLSEWVMAATYQSQGRSGGRRAQELTCRTPGTQLCARQPPHLPPPRGRRKRRGQAVCLDKDMSALPYANVCVFYLFLQILHPYLRSLLLLCGSHFQFAVCQVAGKQDASGQRNKRWFSVHGSEWLQLWQMFQGGRKPDLFFIL